MASMSPVDRSVLDAEELARQLTGLPGVVTDGRGRLTVAVRAPSFLDAVRLVTLVAQEAEQLDHHPDVDLRWRTVVFTLATHSAGGVTRLDVELAHRILDAATTVAALTQPAPQRVELALDCVDPDAVRPFWKAGLGYREQGGITTTAGGADVEPVGTELQDPAGRGPILWFQPMDPPRTERGRFHLDVYLPDGDVALARVQACVDAGGRLVSDAHAPDWWVLADPEGNELCICTRSGDPVGG